MNCQQYQALVDDDVLHERDHLDLIGEVAVKEDGRQNRSR